MESADHVVDLVRVSDILQGTSCPIPNFHQLGLFKKDSMDMSIESVGLSTHKKPPVRGVSLNREVSPNSQCSNSNQSVSERAEKETEKAQEMELEASKSEEERDSNQNSKLPRTVSELRQVLRESTFQENGVIVSEKTKGKAQTKKKKAPLPPDAAHKFVKLMLQHQLVKDIALAVPPNQDNSKKRKRGVSAVREDVAADIFNEDRLNHIHGWVELKTGEKKSFFVSHYQPIMLDVDVKDGGQYDELAFWIELRPSTKGGISSIHGEKVDWFVVENVPRPKSMSTEESVTKFFVCDRNKLCEFLYSKLPEKGTTTNNPFESVYTMYREGRKLQLKTRMPFKDLLNEELLEFRV